MPARTVSDFLARLSNRIHIGLHRCLRRLQLAYLRHTQWSSGAVRPFWLWKLLEILEQALGLQGFFAIGQDL